MKRSKEGGKRRGTEREGRKPKVIQITLMAIVLYQEVGMSCDPRCFPVPLLVLVNLFEVLWGLVCVGLKNIYMKAVYNFH